MRRGHTMTVPDWLWDRAKVKFGVENPASRLLDWMAAHWLSENENLKPDAPKEARKSRDKGKVIVASHDSICGYIGKCVEGKVCKAGTHIMMFEGNSYHLECFAEMKAGDKAA